MKKLLVIINSSLVCLALSFSSYGTENTEADENAEKKPEESRPVSTGDKIYTWIDKYGNRIYSDQPREGAEVMELQKGTDYTPPVSAEPDWSTMKPKVISTGDSYSHFEIASPANDATIRNNNGVFQVALDIRPKLVKGHRIKLEVDGAAVAGSSQIISLTNIDRGTHTLIAYILSTDNAVMATTKPVIVHLHRAIKRGGG